MLALLTYLLHLCRQTDISGITKNNLSNYMPILCRLSSYQERNLQHSAKGGQKFLVLVYYFLRKLNAIRRLS